MDSDSFTSIGPETSRIQQQDILPTAVKNNLTSNLDPTVNTIFYQKNDGTRFFSWNLTTGKITIGSTSSLDLSGSSGTLSAPTGGIAPVSSFTTFYAGGVAPIATTSGTDTTPASGTVFFSSVFIPNRITLTGIAYLIGSVGGTDKAIASLYNNSGVLLANSALAGTLVGTSATWQSLKFVNASNADTPYTAAGPAGFFIGISFNGTTARLRTHASGAHVTQATTGVFGTLATLSIPTITLFTADKGPYSMTY